MGLHHRVVGNARPTMAISTIKYNENRQPKQAKYRVVALGNLDTNEWIKEETYAPVLCILELQILTILAIKHCCKLKNCDIKQAFCEGILPSDEKYILNHR